MSLLTLRAFGEIFKITKGRRFVVIGEPDTWGTSRLIHVRAGRLAKPACQASRYDVRQDGSPPSARPEKEFVSISLSAGLSSSRHSHPTTSIPTKYTKQTSSPVLFFVDGLALSNNATMPRRGIRIKINPHDRFDLSHLNADEANQTLRHILHDLCFWGALPISPKETYHAAGTPHYFHNHFGERSAQLLRQQSSGSESLQSSSRGGDRNKTRSSQTTSTSQDGPPRNQPSTRWKTAYDPTSRQTYYYDPLTRQTQWEKPDEIRAIEKEQRKERRKRDKAFFAEMEKNMRSHFADGRLTKEFTPSQLSQFVGGPPKEPLALQVPSKQQRIRTISAMDEHMLAAVDVDRHSSPDNTFMAHPTNQRRPTKETSSPLGNSDLPPSSSHRPGRPPLPSSRAPLSSMAEVMSSPEESNTSRYDQWDSLELSPDDLSAHANIGSPELEGMRLLDEQYTREISSHPEEERQPQGHMRRNTSNTMFVNSTMASPDIQGTIRCICAVYRTHILQSMDSPQSPGSVVPVGSTVINPDIFRDDLGGELVTSESTSQKIPSLEDIESFYKEFFRRSQMEHDTIIMSLIYIERLIKRTEGGIRPTPLNWRSMLFGCMILASKVWDDLSMWNIDFSNVSVATGLSSFTIQRINQLEIALLTSLRFDVRVPASEYAKYYFLIRTMLFRSGQLSDEPSSSSQNMPAPLAAEQTPSQTFNTRRTKSVDWNAGPLLTDVKLEQLSSLYE